MNRMMISTFALCLAAASPAALWAQEGQHDQSRPSNGEEHKPSGGDQSRPSGGMSSRPASRPADTSTPRESSSRRAAPSTSHHHAPVTHATSRAPERSHVKVDVATYRKTITAERRFHYGEYRAPRGYEYRRWSSGERLPAIYFGRDYWIPNYINFGLAYAPDGCVWVRYGSDAILVDEYTGEIVEVVYDVFY